MPRSRSSHVLSGLLGVLPVLLAWFVLWPSPAEPVPEGTRKHVRRAKLGKKVLKRRLVRTPGAEEAVAASSSPSLEEDVQPAFSPVWQEVRSDLRSSVYQNHPMPDRNTSPPAIDDYLTRTRLRRNELLALEQELVDLIETEPEPYSRLDAQVLLAELYLEQASIYDKTWIPPHFSDDRADRVLHRLERRAAVARDKSRLVVGLAQTEASRVARFLPVDDRVLERLAALDGHGG